MSFWEMGGYAAYVWPAFGVTVVLLLALLGLSLRGLWARERSLRALEAARSSEGAGEPAPGGEGGG
jgi:heme exporter protein D